MTLTRPNKAKIRKDYPVDYRRNLVISRKEATQEEYDEALVAASKRAVHDFEFFCNALLGMRMHTGQVSIIDLMNGKDFGVLAASNRWGKTVFYGCLMLWATYVRKWAPVNWPQYKAVVTGPEMKHALLTHNEIEKIRTNRHRGQMWDKEFGGDGEKHECLIAPLLLPWTTKDQHAAFKWAHNDSLLFFESAQERGSAFEGQEYNLFIYDEARRELHLKVIVEEVVLARGVSAPNMKIILGSTPMHDSYDLWEYLSRAKRGDPDWWYKEGNISENFFVNAAQVEKIRRNLDPRVAAQVLGGEFVRPPDSYFMRERVMACFDDKEPEPDIDRWEGKPDPKRIYVGGVDPATAEGGDDSVVTIWDLTGGKARVVFQKVFNGVSSTDLVSYCDVLIKEFGCQMGYDAQGPLGVEFTHNVSVESGWYVPVKFGGANLGGIALQKANALANFRYFVNNELWSSPNIPELKQEMIQYEVKDERLRKDRLMAQVYAAWVAKDYLGESFEGMQLNPMSDIYGGTVAPFSGRDDEKPMSKSRRDWMRIVEASKQREEAERIAKDLSSGIRS